MTEPALSNDANGNPKLQHVGDSNGTNGPAKIQQVAEGKGFEMGKGEMAALTQPPHFAPDDFEGQRAYLKERLAASLRIFAHLGYDHHVVS